MSGCGLYLAEKGELLLVVVPVDKHLCLPFVLQTHDMLQKKLQHEKRF